MVEPPFARRGRSARATPARAGITWLGRLRAPTWCPPKSLTRNLLYRISLHCKEISAKNYFQVCNAELMALLDGPNSCNGGPHGNRPFRCSWGQPVYLHMLVRPMSTYPAELLRLTWKGANHPAQPV